MMVPELVIKALMAQRGQQVYAQMEALSPKLEQINLWVSKLFKDFAEIKKKLNSDLLDRNTQQTLLSFQNLFKELRDSIQSLFETYEAESLGLDNYVRTTQQIDQASRLIESFYPISQTPHPLQLELQQDLIRFFQDKIKEYQRKSTETDVLTEQLEQLRRLQDAIECIHFIDADSLAPLKQEVRVAQEVVEGRLVSQDRNAYEVALQEKKLAGLKKEFSQLEQKKISLARDLDKVAQQLDEKKRMVDEQVAKHQEQRQTEMLAFDDKINQQQRELTVKIAQSQKNLETLAQQEKQLTQANQEKEQTLTATTAQLAQLQEQIKDQSLMVTPQAIYGAFVIKFKDKTNSTGIKQMMTKMEEIIAGNTSNKNMLEQIGKMMHDIACERMDEKVSKWSDSHRLFKGRQELERSLYTLMMQDGFSLQATGPLMTLANAIGLTAHKDDKLLVNESPRCA